MGGIVSGNHGGKPTVESGLVLDLYRLIGQGTLKPGQYRSGTITWSETYSGRSVASVGYEANLIGERGWVRLHYTTTDYWTGEKTRHDYRVEVVTTPQPFGGRRWWWVCPRRGDLVSKLYQPAGGGIFASRKAHRIAYHSQRQSPRDRALNRAFKLRHRLGCTGGIGELTDKPRGMRWRTYDRHMERIDKAEQIATGHTWLLIDRLNKRLRR